MYRAGDVSVHRACCERQLPNSTLLEGGVRFIQTNDQQMLPQVVREWCLLTRSILIKMYYHFMVCACVCTIVFTVSQFHADVSI